MFTLASLRCTGNQRALLPGCHLIYYGHSLGYPRCEMKVAKTPSAAAQLLPCQPCSALIHTAVLELRAALSWMLRAVQRPSCPGVEWLFPDVSHQEKLLMDAQANVTSQSLPVLTPGCPSLVLSSLLFTSALQNSSEHCPRSPQLLLQGFSSISSQKEVWGALSHCHCNAQSLGSLFGPPDFCCP